MRGWPDSAACKIKIILRILSNVFLPTCIQQETDKTLLHKMHIKQIPLLAEPISDTSPTDVVTALQVVGEYIAIALDNSEIHVFALDGRRKHSLKGCQGPVWTIAMRGDLLCAGGADKSIRIWDLLTGYTFNFNNIVCFFK